MLHPEGSNILQYSPFNSLVDPSFWHKLSQVKLDVDKLEEKVRSIWGYYSNAVPPGLTSFLHVDCSAYNTECEVQKPMVAAHGILLNKNTLEGFKNCNKIALLEELGQELWQNITSGKTLENPALLSRFFLLTYADLKKYNFYYWFAFPAPNFPTVTLKKQPLRLCNIFLEKQAIELARVFLEIDDWRQRGYFLVRVDNDGDSISILPLCDVKRVSLAIPDGEDIKKAGGVYLGVADPCPLHDHPGWPLRNLLALLSYHWYALWYLLHYLPITFYVSHYKYTVTCNCIKSHLSETKIQILYTRSQHVSTNIQGHSLEHGKLLNTIAFTVLKR